MRNVLRAPVHHGPDDLTDPDYWAWVERNDPRYRPGRIVLDIDGRKVEMATPLRVWGASTLVLEGVAERTPTQIELNRHVRGETPLTSWMDGYEKAVVRLIATHYAGGSLGPVRTLHSAIALAPRGERAASTIMYWRYYSDSFFNYCLKTQVWGVTNTCLPVGGIEQLFGAATRKAARVRVMVPESDRFGALGFVTSTPRGERRRHEGSGLEMVWNPGAVLEERRYEMTDGAYVSKANINQNVRFAHHRGTRLVGDDELLRFDESRGDRLRADGAFADELAQVGFVPKRWSYYPSYDGSVYVYQRYPGAGNRPAALSERAAVAGAWRP